MKFKFTYALTAASLVLFGCNNQQSEQAGNEKQPEAKPVEQMKEKDLAFDPAALPEEPVFDIETSEGTIRVKLYKETPQHRDNFVKLASERFYDGILFHRIINNFMIQVGDPLTKDPQAAAKYGTGGPGYTIPAEIVPQYRHKKGALAAARLGDTSNPERASSGSQFYIVQDEAGCSHLDGAYSVFGETLEGLDVVDKIASVPTNAKGLPETPVKIISIRPAAE